MFDRSAKRFVWTMLIALVLATMPVLISGRPAFSQGVSENAVSTGQQPLGSAYGKASATPVPIVSSLPSNVPSPTAVSTQGTKLDSANPDGLELVFDDEFSGSKLDTTKWRTTYKWGRNNAGNNEAQYYADNAFSVKDGVLSITARKETAHGFDYQSGMISSWGTFSQQYGRWEIRCKFSFMGTVGQNIGRGYWPAFWMLPDNPEYYGHPAIHPVPEFDVVEYEGSLDYLAWQGAGWDDHSRGYKTYVGGDNFARRWHTYRMDWSPRGVVFYVDGAETGRMPDPPNSRPVYVIANLAIAGSGAWPPAPNQSTVFPGSLDIDYIRVYKYSGLPSVVSPTPTGAVIGRPKG